jgi:hypothetical protein
VQAYHDLSHTSVHLMLVLVMTQVHLEDAVNKKNRETIGDFSLMKLQGPKDKNEYTITIPRPVRQID